MMPKLSSFTDSLSGFVNRLTGLGGARDKGAHGQFYFKRTLESDLAAAYRASWLCGNIVDAPVDDALREGWRWSDDKLDDIQNKLKLVQKIDISWKRARLYGASAIVLHDGGDASQPLRQVGPERLRVAAIMHNYLTPGQLVRNPFDDGYERPEYYRINTVDADMAQTEVHPSRVVELHGVPMLNPLVEKDGWMGGDSVLERVMSAVHNAARGTGALASLLEEAKVDVYGIPDLTNLISTIEGEAALMRRVQLAQQAKSISNTIVLDADEAAHYTQKTINFSNLPDVVRVLFEEVCGAADIPMTRLFGQQTKGLSNDGKGDLHNYYDLVSAKQRSTLTPVLERFAWAAGFENVTVEYTPLYQPSAKEEADTYKTRADAYAVLSATGEVDDDVLLAMQKSYFGGSDSPMVAEAYDKVKELPEAEEPDDEDVAVPPPPPIPGQQDPNAEEE